ncbi:MAG: hypothetical protein E7262_04745 [Lachnospiraceae bacterium]|nr:hypothetical protein [Lachnospiraceae bacterium]
MTKYYIKTIIIGFLLACSLSLSGCGKEDKALEIKKVGNYKVYYPNAKETDIVSDYVNIDEEDTDTIINELIIKLKEGNYSDAKAAVIPADVEYATYTLEADILTVTFDDNYLNLKGMKEVLKRAAIVFTLIQVDEVDYVRFQVNGKALTIDKEEIGDMSEDTFRDLIGDDADTVVDEQAKIYYADSTGKKLRSLNVHIESDGTQMKEEVIISKIIEGPKGTDKLGYYRTINPATRINRVAINNKVCYIDFSEDFLERRDGVSEDVVIYSIVNSLTELNTVNQVRITVNGEVKEIFNEYANLGGFLERNYDIISYGE